MICCLTIKKYFHVRTYSSKIHKNNWILISWSNDLFVIISNISLQELRATLAQEMRCFFVIKNRSKEFRLNKWALIIVRETIFWKNLLSLFIFTMSDVYSNYEVRMLIEIRFEPIRILAFKISLLVVSSHVLLLFRL